MRYSVFIENPSMTNGFQSVASFTKTDTLFCLYFRFCSKVDWKTTLFKNSCCFSNPFLVEKFVTVDGNQTTRRYISFIALTEYQNITHCFKFFAMTNGF